MTRWPVTGNVRPMAILLIRHGNAGTRANWKGDDQLRPLSNKGLDQARYVAKLLGDRPIGRLFSSPSLRCVQTIEPLARQLGIDVKTREVFAEGADPERAVSFLLDRVKHDPAVCAHGDLIPKVIRRLIATGMRTRDPNLSEKGSVWEIEVQDGRARSALYLPPGSTKS